MVEFFSLRILEFHGVRLLGACECSGSSPTHVYIKSKRYGISWVVEQKMPVGKLRGDVFRLDVDDGKGGKMSSGEMATKQKRWSVVSQRMEWCCMFSFSTADKNNWLRVWLRATPATNRREKHIAYFFDMVEIRTTLVPSRIW